jgi:hypothetical protein
MGNQKAAVFRLCDGNKAQISEVIGAFMAQGDVTLFALPPHRSDMLQSLYQSFSRRRDSQYKQSPLVPNLERVT